MAQGSIRTRQLEARGANGRKLVSYDAYVEGPRAPDGKRKRVKKTFGSRADAAAWISKQLHAKATGKWTATPGTFGDLCTTWLEAKEAELKPSTYHTYERHVRHYLSALSDKKVTVLSSADLTKLYGKLTAKGLSATTVRSVHATVRACFSWAIGQEPPLADVNPALRAKPPGRKQKEMSCWSGPEIAKILACADPLFAPVYLLIANTGLRRGEAVGLRWEDVDEQNSQLWVRQTLVPSGGALRISTPKTESSTRTVPMTESVKQLLKARRAAQRLERVASGKRTGEYGDLVFTKGDGVTPLDTTRCSRAFASAVSKAGVRKGRLHDLRHSFATIALTEGIPLLVVSKVLGHAQPSTTLNVYGHLMPDAGLAAVQAVEGTIAK